MHPHISEFSGSRSGPTVFNSSVDKKLFLLEIDLIYSIITTKVISSYIHEIFTFYS